MDSPRGRSRARLYRRSFTRRMCPHLHRPGGEESISPLPIYGVPYVWIFEKYGRELKVQIEGQLVFNNIAPSLNAALAEPSASAFETPLRPKTEHAVFGAGMSRKRRHWVAAVAHLVEQVPVTC
jgi:hypothetical protein